MNIRTIYAEQFGSWWKLTPEQWRAICEEGVKTGGHTLPSSAMLRIRPRTIAMIDYEDGEGSPSYYSRVDGILIYSPLDWEEENYADALKELDEAQKVK